MKRKFPLSITLLLLIATSGWADLGSIPFEPGVEVYKPTQRALVAFNGQEEILVLSTDLSASRPTKVLEVMPLPSRPVVTKADNAIFQKCIDLLNSKLPMKTVTVPQGKAGYPQPATRLAPAIDEIVLHKTIGAHDIIIAQVLDGKTFVEGVEKYLRQKGVKQPTIPLPIRQAVSEYIRDGYTWFAFDLIDLGKETLTRDAIAYRFQTNLLYYPLRISRSDSGNTEVGLMILTPGLVTLPQDKSLKLRLVHTPVRLTHAAVRDLDPQLLAFLRNGVDYRLRIWKIEGRPATFRRDVLTR